MRKSRIGLTLITLFLATSTTWAAQMYRYQSENGRTVMSNTLPADAAKRGYEILNSKGRVIETVAPAPTEEEIAEQERREAERKKAEEAARKQQELDRQLLRLYSHPDEAARAMNRKLEEMRSIIQLKRSNQATAESQIRQEQSRAADMERAGKTVPQSLLNKIQRLRGKVREVQDEIDSYKKELDQTMSEFRDKIQRLEEITGNSRTVPLQIDTSEDDKTSEDQAAAATN